MRLSLGLVLVAGASTAQAQTPPLTESVLKNTTYPIAQVPGGMAKFADGLFEVPAAPGSATKASARYTTSAIGTIGGQPRAAVIVVGSGGGTGQFVYLFLVDGAGNVLASEFLGDRTRVDALTLERDRVIVDLVVARTTDPACCPTLAQHREYTVAGNALVATITPPTTPPVPPRPAATGSAGPATVRTATTFAFAALALAILGVATARRTVRAR